MNEKNIIIINGSGGVGKDTLMGIFAKTNSVNIISTVDMVKLAAIELGWDGNKDDASRKTLSELKEFWNSHDNVLGGSTKWVAKECEQFKASSNPYEWLFIQCREPENIEKIVKIVPTAKTILVARDGVGMHGNKSDDNVMNYKYDLIFVNEGTIEESGKRFESAIYELFDMKVKD